MPPAPQALTIPRLQLCSFVAKKWLLCFRSRSKLSYKRVGMTYGFLCLPPGMALDKTPNTSKKKFCMRRLILSILNLLTLMLTELQKSLTSINSFKKVMARKDGKERWWGKMTKKDDDFSPYALVSLHTCLSMHLSPYALVSLLRLCTNWKIFWHKYPFEIIYLLRNAVCHPQLSQYGTRKLSCHLDAIDAPPLCGS